jgi:aminoglycoside phosphotransferase (APT) family kinase protein
VQRSSRDAEYVADAVSDWLAGMPEFEARPAITVEAGAETSGMSSDTIIMSGTSVAGGQTSVQRWAARVEPSSADIPVFHEYRLDRQFETLRQVARLTDVPVPQARWVDLSGDVIGAPFFLMDFVEGVVPPDVLPYTFGDNWFANASAEDRHAMQEAYVDILARLHAIPDPQNEFAFLRSGDAEDPSGLQAMLAWLHDWYDFTHRTIGRSETTEHLLAWLDANLPDRTGVTPVLSWGDARIGNILWRDCAPVAVLDWEMASLAPAEFDIAWGILAHRVLDDLARMLGLPGMPELMREEDIVASYQARTGRQVGDLRWYYVFGVAAWCCIFLRTGARRVHFGEMPAPEDVESLFMHRSTLDAVLAELS